MHTTQVVGMEGGPLWTLKLGPTRRGRGCGNTFSFIKGPSNIDLTLGLSSRITMRESVYKSG